MIIYLFNDSFFTKVNLPSVINGMYSLNNKEELVANIISNEKNWMIELSSDFICNEINTSNNILSLYKIYNIQHNNGDPAYTIVAIPKYDTSSKLYDLKGGFTLGNNPNCDIYYPLDEVNNKTQEFIKVNKVNNSAFWQVETNSNKFLYNNSHIVNGTYIKNGDYIFFYGLKVIVIGSTIMINNPNNSVVVKSQVIAPRADEPDFVNQNGDVEVKQDEPLFKKEDYFYKAPRFNFILETDQVDFDEPPGKIDENDELPAIVVVGPQITMVMTSVLSMFSFMTIYSSGKNQLLRLILTLSITVSSILSAVLWPNISRRINKKRLRRLESKRVEKYGKYLESKKAELYNIKKKQLETLLQNHPSAADCSKIIKNKSKELWQRNIDHDDFLSIRVGLGTINTQLAINVPKEKFTIEDEDQLFTKMKQIVDDSLFINDAPITYSFTQQNISAIVGRNDLIKKFMDNVFLQIMTFHSYTDLKIVVFTKEPEKWDYLKIIPHCWDNQKVVRYFATTVEDFSVISSDLEKIFDARVANDETEKLEDNGEEDVSKKKFKDFRPYYLFFIDDISSIRNMTLINKILHYKRNMGFSIILTSDSISLLPSEASNFIAIGDHDSAILTSHINDNQRIFKADLSNKDFNIKTCCKDIANIPIQVEKLRFELPTSLSFLETYNVGRVEQLNCISRWHDNNPVMSLAVPIGVDQSGEIFKMNIHEKAFGPHGLIAGTTGSGKSEWIVTLILALAVNFSPEEVQFVIIDYKGGGLAMSFENSKLGIKLPHIAGKITNLEKSEMFRTIAAIESELTRRQRIFNEAREKLKEGSMNIYKYQDYYRKGMVDEPLSHLLIICDEFAELKQQQPDFMDQLISTSRIGRSLGIHLILATQKPSGVVNDQIWSNSRFKVCLKVQDKSDSNEILKKPDAAYLKQVGSFYIQVGNDDYYSLGQAAWAGAKYKPSNVIKHEIDDSIVYIDNIGRVLGSYKEHVDEVVEDQGEELLNIVSYIFNSSKQLPLKNKPLWLDNIPSKIYLNDLIKKYNHQKSGPYIFNVLIGEYDEPRMQKQGPLYIDLEKGNVAIIGQNNSGIDQVISTIIFSIMTEHNPHEIALYIIDFGAETMKKFSRFPHVGEVLFQEDVDNISNLLNMIVEEMEKRKDLLSDYNGSYEYYNKVSKEKLQLITVVINSYDIFLETFGNLEDVMTNFFRDALKYGIVFIVSVNSPSALRYRVVQYFEHMLVLGLNDDSQYRDITGCRRNLIPMKVPGRGICKVDYLDSDSFAEFQTASIIEDEKELEFLRLYADKCIDYYKYKVKQLAKIPDDVTSADLIKYIADLSNVPIGYDYYKKDVARYNFLSQKMHIISCSNIKDNIEFIYGLVSIISNIPSVNVRVIDFSKIFEKLIIDIKLFNSDLDVVTAALENDVLTRTESQDYAVNIIVGVGSFKSVLSEGGQEIFDNLFKNITSSHKSIYVLIDNYESIRNLKFESWFDQIDLSNGIWVGQDFDIQSLFTTNVMSQDDKKLQFKGIGYTIESGTYNPVKVVMDGDD